MLDDAAFGEVGNDLSFDFGGEVLKMEVKFSLLIGVFFEEAEGAEEFDFFCVSGARDEGFPDFAGLVLAVFVDGEVVGDEGDGQGVEGVVKVGETANFVFGFRDAFEDGVAIGAVSFRERVIVGPVEGRFAFIVGAFLGGLQGFFVCGVGFVEGGEFLVSFGDESSGEAVAFFEPAHGVVAADVGVAQSA